MSVTDTDYLVKWRHRLEDLHTVNWDSLCAWEPKLRAVESWAANWPTDENYCEASIYGRYIKPAIERLVGWQRVKRDGDEPLLYSTTAYDIAHRRITEAMPMCEHPGPCVEWMLNEEATHATN